MEATDNKKGPKDPGDTIGHIQPVPGPTPYNQKGDENPLTDGPHEKDAAGDEDQIEEQKDRGSDSESAQR